MTANRSPGPHEGVVTPDPWQQFLRELTAERHTRTPPPPAAGDDPDAQALRRAQAGVEYERWTRRNRQGR